MLDQLLSAGTAARAACPAIASEPRGSDGPCHGGNETPPKLKNEIMKTKSLSGNTLYGTAGRGGSAGAGTVFAVNTDGTGFTNLHSFTYGSDGANPQAGLILSGNTLYGAARLGGSAGYGAVFAVNTDGTGFTTVYSFTRGNDGAYPGGLVLSGNTLYGTASQGGSSDHGTVFKVNTDGTGFTTLYNFTGGSDGNSPSAALILSGNTLYGTAVAGGSSGDGTVFAVNIDGTGFTTLHSFTGTNTADSYNPQGGLLLSGSTLYGTAYDGGSSGNGMVFAVNTDGASFTSLYSFTGGSDGCNPDGLILSGNTLYGTAFFGGSSGWGTVFALNTDGTGFTNLHSFTARSINSSGYYTNSDGALPVAGLILSGNTLYGTANIGGSSDHGTVFSISFRPQLTITPSGANVILSWPTNVAGFDYTGYTLQSTTNLGSPSVWSANSPAPVVVNGQNTVTNSITAAQQFYRLIR